MYMEDYNKELSDALFCLNRLQSENYDGETHDLQPAQERIRHLLSHMELSRGLVRLMIECQQDVRNLRNKLDDCSNYGVNTVRCNDCGIKMRPDVLELMNRRNVAAARLGYTSYGSAILEADDLTAAWVKSKLNAYLDMHLSDVARRAKEADIFIDDWFAWLSRENALEHIYDLILLLDTFTHRLGIKDVLPKLNIRSADSFCYASQLDSEHIIMQVSPISDVASWTTVFHEFGHACVYANLPKNSLPYLSPLVDEVFAVLFENLAVRLLAEGTLRSRALSVLHTEYTRTCISGMFELDLWQDPSDPERLYESWYHRLGVKVEPCKWAVDSFRSIDCMTIFAYTIGQILADFASDEKLLHLLPKLVKRAADITLFDLVKECMA